MAPTTHGTKVGKKEPNSFSFAEEPLIAQECQWHPVSLPRILYWMCGDQNDREATALRAP